MLNGLSSILDGRRHNITLVNVDEQDQVYLVVDGRVEDMQPQLFVWKRDRLAAGRVGGWVNGDGGDYPDTRVDRFSEP